MNEMRVSRPDAASQLTGLRSQAAQADAELTKLWQKILAERAARARAARAAAVRAARRPGLPQRPYMPPRFRSR